MPINELWETGYKPKILISNKVPLPLVAEILGCSVQTVHQMLRSGMYSFGTARKAFSGGKTSYDVFPLRFIAWYEGRLL